MHSISCRIFMFSIIEGCSELEIHWSIIFGPASFPDYLFHSLPSSLDGFSATGSVHFRHRVIAQFLPWWIDLLVWVVPPTKLLIAPVTEINRKIWMRIADAHFQKPWAKVRAAKFADPGIPVRADQYLFIWELLLTRKSQCLQVVAIKLYGLSEVPGTEDYFFKEIAGYFLVHLIDNSLGIDQLVWLDLDICWHAGGLEIQQIAHKEAR